MDGTETSDATLTVDNVMTGLFLISENIATHWEDSSLTGHLANLRVPQIPNFETQVLLPIMGAAQDLGVQQGIIITCERERLNIDDANAVADVQNRNAQLNSQVEGAHMNLSVRESNIAGAGNQVMQLQQQLEATRAQLQEREFNLGVLSAQLQEQQARLNARDAETAGRDEAPATRHSAEDGVTTLPHPTSGLMAGGVPLSAVRHGPAAYRQQPDNVGRPHFHPSVPLPSRTSPLNAHSPTEEDSSFCAFDATTWPTRIWNEGTSGVVFDLRGAY
ncbi:hypothetical protein MOQ_007206 [Trypanosoma cruzi marinkellei]|uniref:Uncharacterized protein n=1 Tax=Trypanosoma cruzi marinkellei TaxID=85056 RepID=K2M268_TRYCR|nr:hypothetical protein MOQ_007206 [Trypanosoma cruzi marinkellei]